MRISKENKILAISLMIYSASVLSCSNNNEVPIPETQISYSMDMQPYFDAKCIGCHGSRNPNLETPDSYDNIINGGFVNTANPPNSSLYTVLDGFMGTDVTDDEKAMTLKWIEQGAKNN